MLEVTDLERLQKHKTVSFDNKKEVTSKERTLSHDKRSAQVKRIQTISGQQLGLTVGVTSSPRSGSQSRPEESSPHSKVQSSVQDPFEDKNSSKVYTYKSGITIVDDKESTPQMKGGKNVQASVHQPSMVSDSLKTKGELNESTNQDLTVDHSVDQLLVNHIKSDQLLERQKSDTLDDSIFRNSEPVEPQQKKVKARKSNELGAIVEEKTKGHKAIDVSSLSSHTDHNQESLLHVDPASVNLTHQDHSSPIHSKGQDQQPEFSSYISQGEDYTAEKQEAIDQKDANERENMFSPAGIDSNFEMLDDRVHDDKDDFNYDKSPEFKSNNVTYRDEPTVRAHVSNQNSSIGFRNTLNRHLRNRDIVAPDQIRLVDAEGPEEESKFDNLL